MLKSTFKKINRKIYPSKFFFPPEWIVLGVNNVCNLHCKMCDVGTNSIETNFAQNLIGTNPLNMPISLLEKIIDQIAFYYPNTKLGYAFTEPLIYPFLEKSLAYAKQHKIKTSITTNALNLKQKAKILVKEGLDELFISLDGPQDIHNKIRGNNKSYQKAVEGIDEIFKLNPNQKVSLFCVITEWNIGFLKEFVDNFKNYPIVKIGFMHTNFTPEHIANSHNEIWMDSYPTTASNIYEININNYNLDLLWEEIKEIKAHKYKFPISFSPEIGTKANLNDFYRKPDKLIGKMCNDVFSNIMIKSDGSAIPAHGRCYNLPIGNIYDKSLKEIWNSNILRKFRLDLIANGGLLPACSRCCSAF